jgi:hypothetical protein
MFILHLGNSLSKASRELLIGQGGPMAWLARSAHLNPLDYYVWGHPNYTVRAAEEDNDVQQLQQRVQHGFKLIPTFVLFQGVRQ